MPHILWSPKNKEITHPCHLSTFRDYINTTYQLDLQDYTSLHQWSVKNIEKFWSSLWHFCDVSYSKPPTHIRVANPRMQNNRWFVGAQLNFAENLLKPENNQAAIIAASERGDYETITYCTLRQHVARLAHTLKTMGLQPGDRVAAMLPNTPHAVIAMLATASLGGVWSACSPDFGLTGLIDRFSQIEPKILFTVDGHFYKGKTFLHHHKNSLLTQKLPSVTHTIVVNYIDKKTKLAGIKNARLFSDCLSQATQELEYVQLPFDHPLYILYSSGTTGKPKCLVHGAGGTLLQHLKELMLHTNLHPQERIFFNSTVTWMMWHWLVSSLAVGSCIVLYEGSPLHPNPEALFDLIEKAEINIFGVGATFFQICQKQDLHPINTHRLNSLKTILTTGSPLLPASFDYIYTAVDKNIQVSSISGGSDLISCFALGNPTLPVYRGEIQCLGLGMDVKIYNSNGEPVINEKGELVCTQPFPSMPLYFYNDPDGKKYQRAYFDTFPKVWTHGDYAMITPRGSLIIYGRSDTTLNPNGVRIGSSEIYQQLEKFSEITEALVVGQTYKGNERIILFVILRQPCSLDEKLIKKISTDIRHNTSPHHVPAKIIAVKDLPRTANNKISEIAVKKIINGQSIDHANALINPESLNQFKNLKKLRDN